MGKRSREKQERREQGITAQKKERPEFGLEAVCKKIIFIGTCLILFTPLIMSARFFFPFVGPKSLYFMGLVEIIFFTWLFLIIFWPKYRPRLSPILLALAIFLVILILASLFGVDPTYSFWSKFERMTGILMMLHLLAFFVVISTVFKEKDWIKVFLVSIFVGVILSFITFVAKNPTMRGGATVGNDSFLGTYLLFDLFLALYLIFKTNGGLKIYSIICFSIMGFALLLSDARAAKLSFLGGLIVLFFLYLAFAQKKKLRLVGISLLTLLIIGTVFFVFFAFQPESFVRKGIIEKGVGETFGGRFIVWQSAWEGFLERPLLGWGLENFEYAFLKNYNPCFGISPCGGDIWYDRAHNIIFDTLVISGILGMLSYFGILGIVSFALILHYVRKNIGFWTAGIFLVILISYSIQNFTVFDMVSSYMMFFLVLGFVGSLYPKNTNEIKSGFFPQKENRPTPSSMDWKKNNLKKQSISIILLILLTLSLFKFVIQPLKSDFYIIKAVQAKSPQERVPFYKKSLSASPVGKYQAREQFADLALGSFYGQGATTFSVEDFKAEFDFVSEELEKTIKESPLNYRSYLRLGQIYNAQAQIAPEKLSKAEVVLQRAIEISPKNQQGYWELAQVKLYRGESKEAFSLAEKALELEPKMPRSHLIVVWTAKIMGDNDLANKKAEEAIKIIPSLEPELKKILGVD